LIYFLGGIFGFFRSCIGLSWFSWCSLGVFGQDGLKNKFLGKKTLRNDFFCHRSGQNLGKIRLHV